MILWLLPSLSSKFPKYTVLDSIIIKLIKAKCNLEVGKNWAPISYYWCLWFQKYWALKDITGNNIKYNYVERLLGEHCMRISIIVCRKHISILNYFIAVEIYFEAVNNNYLYTRRLLYC